MCLLRSNNNLEELILDISKFVPTICLEETEPDTYSPNLIFHLPRDRWQYIVKQMVQNRIMLVEIVRLEQNGDRNCMVTGSYLDYKKEELMN